jgi:isoleucyl-tRNA synthetase
MADDNTPNTEAGRDYRDTVFLPQTPFPMRAGLPQKEPEILAGWERDGLYARIRAARQAAGAPLYVLHDGPPYANGAIHIGHALNKILKDFVVRSRFALGYDVDYTPGWDCHGLPIEWKIEEEYRSKGRRKDEVSKAEFRTECRAYAGRWIEAQKTEFKRLGILGNWAEHYTTMAFGSEAAIVGEFHKFLMSGQLYRGSKPVMWSPVERTALADAEVEYHDHVSPTVWVKFPVRGGDASVVIWTTTPWTIPANRAVSFGPEIAYGLYEVAELKAGLEFEPWAKVGDKLILADALAEGVLRAANAEDWVRVRAVPAAQLGAMTLSHPLAALDPGYGFEVPMLSGEHVTEDAGTGFVHTAPGHGQDDYEVWLKSGRSRADIPDTVDSDGAYYPSVPLFGGMKVMETEGKKAGKFGPANPEVMNRLIEAGNLLARGRVEHSYPHSWRSKAPVIFRNTPQWFIRMDEPLDAKNLGFIRMDEPLDAENLGFIRMDQPLAAGGKTLRQTALDAIDDTSFYPRTGQTRIRSMVEGRPDWLISRQRAWGAPLAMFVDKLTGEPLRDEAVNARILAAIAADGADAWFTRDAVEFLGANRDPADYEKIEDILDVWFDSGSTHAFVLENRSDSRWPADLYLEGSDQARGWFQSSLLESCGTRGRAPYRGVLTHGFVLDEHGEKMSKSKGNTTEPQSVTKDSGAEILRLWVAMSDYADDLRIGKTILQTTIDSYRKLRNSLRYLLGALDGFSEAERVGYDAMPPLERYVLHRLWQLDTQVRAAYERHRYDEVWRPVTEFCAQELSALYFDVRKDALYCDAPSSVRRRAARTVMDLAFERLTAWLSPIAVFTTEEAWTVRFPEAGSNALRVFPDTPAEWKNEDEAARWAKIQDVLAVVTGALEVERREKRIGSALEAAPKVAVANAGLMGAFDGVDPAEVFRTSQAELVLGDDAEGFKLAEIEGVAVRPFRAKGGKCARCWRVLPEVTMDLCNRCTAAVAEIDAA